MTDIARYCQIVDRQRNISGKSQIAKSFHVLGDESENSGNGLAAGLRHVFRMFKLHLGIARCFREDGGPMEKKQPRKA